MMNRPPVNELVEKAGSRYMLVTAVAVRARQLQDQPGLESTGPKSIIAPMPINRISGKSWAIISLYPWP